MKRKKILSVTGALVVAFALCFTVAACGGNEPVKLATPTNVAISDDLLISWSAVENATSYTVSYESESHNTSATSYQVDSSLRNREFTFTVVAKAEGYADSDAASGTHTATAPQTPTVTVEIRGYTLLGSGQTTTLQAEVTGSTQGVTWTVQSGSDYATVDQNGVVTAKEVTSEQKVTVRATSKEAATVYDDHEITVEPKPVLTQQMLDEIAGYDVIEFMGSLKIDLYTIGQFSRLYSTDYLNTRTVLNGERWYAEYENNVGVTQPVYYKNNGGIATQVGISYNNEEEYYPLMDDDGNSLTWQKSGYYNNFAEQQLTVDDFSFNESLWRFVYKGADNTFGTRVISSANPYKFDAKTFGLTIEGGEIVGIYGESTDDYSVQTGYRAVMEFEAYIATENVDMPTIATYSFEEEIHRPLQNAIEKMQSLTSYKTTFRNISGNNIAAAGGYEEIVTEDLLYYRNIDWRMETDSNGKIVYRDTYRDTPYGYKNTSAGIYNQFEKNAQGFYGYRSYKGDVDDVKPSFDFNAAIFRGYDFSEVGNGGSGDREYFAASVMSGVASRFYCGIGNSDVQLYGRYALDPADYFLSESYPPAVTVNAEGYITEATFYYYLGATYGIINIQYSDFNTATVPETVEFTEKPIPAAWESEFVYDDELEDLEHPITETFTQMFGAETAQTIPYFGDALGDTFGFGMWGMRMPQGGNISYQCIILYYDVPLDEDLTITSSMDALAAQLVAAGYTKTGDYEYKKGDIGIAIVDNALDFTVYIWNYSKSIITE